MKRFCMAIAMVSIFCSANGGMIPAHGYAQEMSQAGKPFYEKISQIRKFAKKGDWKRARKETTALHKLYQKRKWKLQLIGDEGEYEGLDQEMSKLSEAISAKDQSQTQVELGAIRALIKNIYSL